ncbi:tyrosine-protein phosphatase non-receptor type 22 [Centropristis striata]|uniref:tyrosine-protein phosphatase non-receptor type 22 n=1 Tax=Centropristis striata TaxID=184440 RepID=UPI0027E05E5D|nr:tyrosine-protein phosphatase non-receptor type 22 [Centropristis striata]
MEQQAWILRSFLAQQERQEAADEQAPNGIAGEFARLKSQSTKYRTDRTFPSKTAEKQENIKKNRYKDIVPFDHTRVKLTFTTVKNDTEYINASFIKGVSGSRAYIATQGPLPHTVLDFLRMLWEYNVQVVVMACREFEMGKKKCERYWPQKQEQPFFCDPFTVYCDSEENKGDYLTRTLRVTYRNFSRTLLQLHYVNWPDHGVPDTIQPILDMLHDMRSYQDHDDVPFCIHCSAGCGRTGVLCVIDYTWNLLKKQMIPPDFNIFDLVLNMRTQRPSLVQTKEQYELVYRTIKLLFQRYLQSMDAQTRRNEVTMVPSAIMPDTESELFDPEHHIAPRANDMQRDQEQWHILRTLPEALAGTQDLREGHRASPQLVRSGQRSPAAEERIQGSDDIPSLNPPPSPAVAAAICMMVEDPYFDTPMSSPSSEEAPMDSTEAGKQWTDIPTFNTPSLCLNDQTLKLNSPASGTLNAVFVLKSTSFIWLIFALMDVYFVDTVEAHTDEEAAPPLPQRTPESYVMAVEAGPPEMLMVIIPPNAAAEAVRQLGAGPPSPVPPLPERTPESFELALEQAPVEQRAEDKPAVNLHRLGMSSEWFGDSKPAAAAASQNETKPFMRSKSLKTKMTFTVHTTHHDVASTTTPNLHPYCPPLEPLTPPLLPQTEESLTPPLPDRTPESFILTTEEIHRQTALCPQPIATAQPSPRVGLSSEWDGTSQPKKFLDVVMCRSKSVRAKGSRPESFTAVRQFAPPPVVVAGAGSAPVGVHDVNRRPSLNTEPSGNKSDKSIEKGMSRTRSLKFFRHKQKPKTAPPPPPTQTGAPPASYGASSSVFKFGFGNRFGKPKGPRSYPESWFNI